MARAGSWRAVKMHHSYTVDEASGKLGVCKGTIRRWLVAGLPCLNEQRPLLILGSDLIAFLKQRRTKKRKCAADEFYCFSCHEPKRPAFGAVEAHANAAGRYRLTALCCECATVMNKAASVLSLDALRKVEGVSITLATEALSNGTNSL